MGLRVATNIPAMGISRVLSKETAEQTKSYERLASGQRINHAGDDAVGMAIGESLRSQIRSLAQAERNANDGTSFAQVAEGGLTEVSNMIVRLRELAIQAASDTVGDRERGFINNEVKGILQQVDRLANGTNFNGVNLLNGESKKDTLSFQIGIQNTENDHIKVEVNKWDVRSGTLGIDGLNFSDIDGATDGLGKIDKALSKVFEVRSSLGTIQNNLQSTARSLAETRENYSIARSRITDTDLATETTDLVRSNILQSAGIAVLAQANSSPSQALKLL